MTVPTVSYSEVSSFRRCQKAWEFRYKQGLKRQRKHMRLFKGEILHEMLNAYVNAKLVKGFIGDDPWDVLAGYAEKFKDYFEEEKEHYGDIIADCGEIFEGYLRRYRHDVLRYEKSEVPVYFDISGLKLRFAGFIDKIAVDAQDRRWIVDHKFMQSIPTAEDRFSELQLLLYVWGLGQSNPEIEIDGVLWDYARSKAPTKPEVLKAGGLTQRKNLDCDAYTYMRTISENKLDPNDYVEMLKHLEGKDNSFFERVYLPKPTDAMVKEVVGDFLETAKEIKVKRGKTARCTHSMSPFNCNTCEFRSLCEAEVRGHDTDFVIKADYIQRETGES